MLTAPASPIVYVATKPVDFRNEADRLALLAKETLGHDPMKGVAVVLRVKRADRVKIVVWDGSGLVMYWKRLDSSGFNGHSLSTVSCRCTPRSCPRFWPAWIGRACAPRIPQRKALTYECKIFECKIFAASGREA